MFQPLSTGITFALTEKPPTTKSRWSQQAGRSESQDGGVFSWNFRWPVPTGWLPT